MRGDLLIHLNRSCHPLTRLLDPSLRCNHAFASLHRLYAFIKRGSRHDSIGPCVSHTAQGIFYSIMTMGRASLHNFGTVLPVSLLLASFEVCCGYRILGGCIAHKYNEAVKLPILSEGITEGGLRPVCECQLESEHPEWPEGISHRLVISILHSTRA